MHQLITSTWVCVLILKLSSHSCHGDSVLTFSSTPEVIKENLTRSVTLRCEVTVAQGRTASTDEDISSVVHYWVTYGEDEYVASVTNNEAARGFIDEGNLRVSGSAEGMGYLELTWVTPSAMRMGTYKCHVNGKSKSNTFVQLRKGIRITSEEPNIADLMERINMNEQEIKDEARQLKDTVKEQMERINMNEQEIKDEARQLKDTVKEQTACLSAKVGFMAVMSGQRGHIHINKSSPVVYDQVITDTTNSYNTSTGEFCAPVSGLYSFSVVLVTQHRQWAALQLFVKGRGVVTTAVADTQESSRLSRMDSGALAATVELSAGDYVYVRCMYYGADLWQDDRTHPNVWQVNSFSGHLLTNDACLMQ